MVFSPVSPVAAASIVVNSLADDSLGNLAANGTCDLREAVEAANTDAPVGDCAAGSGADVITFSVTGTIPVNGIGPLALSSDLTITGPGASQLTIDGQLNVQIFSLSNGTYHLSGLTLTRGSSECYGGAIAAFDSADLFADGLVVKDSVAGGECAGRGGGIYTGEGDTTLTNSTISGNTATDGGSGGGYFSDGGAVTMTNVTISGNTLVEGLATDRRGGGFFSHGDEVLNNVTITGNTGGVGGGVYVFYGTLQISNAIIAGNTADTGPDCALGSEYTPSIQSNDYNLIGVLTDCTIGGTTTHNRTGAAGLGPLQNNGGQTPTHALLDASQAVDAGNPAGVGQAPACASTDQRGVARPIDGDAVPGSICDIGAYEKAALTVSSTTAPSTTIGSGPTIPKTGAPETAWQTAAIALALVLMGATILLVTRRRPTA